MDLDSRQLLVAERWTAPNGVVGEKGGWKKLIRLATPSEHAIVVLPNVEMKRRFKL